MRASPPRGGDVGRRGVTVTPSRHGHVGGAFAGFMRGCASRHGSRVEWMRHARRRWDTAPAPALTALAVPHSRRCGPERMAPEASAQRPARSACESDSGQKAARFVRQALVWRLISERHLWLQAWGTRGIAPEGRVRPRKQSVAETCLLVLRLLPHATGQPPRLLWHAAAKRMAQSCLQLLVPSSPLRGV